MFEISTLHTAAIVAFFLGVFVGGLGMFIILRLPSITEWLPQRLRRACYYHRNGYSWRVSWLLSGEPT